MSSGGREWGRGKGRAASGWMSSDEGDDDTAAAAAAADEDRDDKEEADEGEENVLDECATVLQR